MSRNRVLAAQALGLVALFLVGLAIAGSTAFGKPKPPPTGSTGTESTTSSVTTQQATGKVLVCHRTHSKKKPLHTLSVSMSALPAHLRHGDTEGACVLATSQTTGTTSSQPANAHGNSANARGHK